MEYTILGIKINCGIYQGFAYKNTTLFVSYEDLSVNDGVACESFKVKGVPDVKVGEKINVLVDESNKITGVRLAETKK